MPSSRRRKLPLDPAAMPYAWGLLALWALGFLLGWAWLWLLAIVLAAIVLGFFRDPRRPIPQIPGAIVSPADGTVVSVSINQNPEAGPVGGPCVAIFLSVLDVHVNRAPCAGTVRAMRYVEGEKLDARHPEATTRNECNWIHLTCGRHEVTVRQIAGMIARRIVCRIQVGQTLRRGERIGIIKFGSRTELYLPQEARVVVQVGQTLRGGLSIVAFLPEDQI